jgi:N6-L-threonylcarbamoyladenine synthase
LDAPRNVGVPAGDRFPALVLIVSGGHTELILMSGHCAYRRLGGTLDDAAGEAFDKAARLLGLGFPGGPAIQAAAQGGDSRRHPLPRALMRGEGHHYDFSFSGLKTATLNLVRQLEREGMDIHAGQTTADLAASFQDAVVDVLIAKTADAAQAFAVQQVCICGGVSANARLRDLAVARFDALGLPLTIPPLALCTDNAAMIGSAAYFRHQVDPHAAGDLTLDVYANLPLAAG